MYPKIVLFDGHCNLCNGAVQFIIKRDKKNEFKFSSLQSEYGQKVLRQKELPSTEFDSFILLEKGVVYQKSEAALKLLDSFSMPWRIFKVFYLIPRGLRDYIYDKVAGNRYKIFGRKDKCMIPTPELKEKFL